MPDTRAFTPPEPLPEIPPGPGTRGQIDQSEPFAVAAAGIPMPREGKGLRTGAIVGIVLGAVALVGLILTGVVVLAATLVGWLESPSAEEQAVGGSSKPLMSGDPGSPVARSPLECNDPCLSEDFLGQIAVSDTVFDYLGLRVHEDVSEYYPGPPGIDYNYRLAEWEDMEGSPDECFFTIFDTPVVATTRERPSAGVDYVEYVSGHSSAGEFSSLWQAARFFRTTAEAQEHMISLDNMIGSCSHYAYGRGLERWEADVTAVPAVEVPGSVAAVGWVETTEYSRYYVFDLLYGNVVVRSVLSTSDEISELEWRSFVEDFAVHLSEQPIPEDDEMYTIPD